MIRTTLLGHACVLFDVGSHKILSDPHLYDRFASDLFTIYPHRKIDISTLEQPDVIFISHHHRDHFDLRSLVHFDRKTPVLFPRSVEVAYGLRRLGFTDLNPISDWDEVRLGETRLIFTPSRYRVPEHGLLLASEHEVLWNLVDTVIDLEVAAIARRALAHRPVDLLLWPYQPLMEVQAATGDSMSFPTSKLDVCLATLVTIAPRFVVPYADAQFSVGATDFLNHYRFPVEFSWVPQLVADSHVKTEVVTIQPGERICVDGRTVKKDGAVPYVTALPSEARDRTFDTTYGFPPLGTIEVDWLTVTDEPLAATLATLEQRWRSMKGRLGVALSVAEGWGATYLLLIESPDDVHGLEFRPTEDQPSPLTPAEYATRLADENVVVVRVQLGVLQKLLCGHMHFVAAYQSGLFRTFRRVHRFVDGELVEPGELDEYGLVQMSTRGRLLTGPMFLNLLIASAEDDLKQRCIERETEEALRGAS